jgi:hypothetical protein
MAMKSFIAWLLSLGLIILLAGCTTSDHEQSATLTVHVGLFGGPPRPGGGMADSNAPQPNAPIAVTDVLGSTRHAVTDASGLASFSVRPGRYTITSPSCGSGLQRYGPAEPHYLRASPLRHSLTKVRMRRPHR